MIERSVAEAVLKEAKKTGASFSELYLEDTESRNLTLTDGKMENALASRVYGAGVRVIDGTKCAYAYTADTSREGLMLAAENAAAAIEGAADNKVTAFSVKDYSFAPKTDFSEVANSRIISMLKDGYRIAKEYDPMISQVVVRYLSVDQRVTVINSDGVFASDRRPRTRFAIQSTAAKDGEFQTGFEGPGLGMGYEAYEHIDIEKAAREASRTAVTMVSASECPSGVFPVVIDGGFGGVIFHEACGHSLEATSVSKGNSEFCGKLGQKIASDIVSAVDDGTIPGAWGSLGMDDEGNPTRRNLLIENGILKSYMIDKLGGIRMEMDPTASSRRQNYTFEPTSRMTNTFICAGNDDDEEMIASMGEGLYAKSMGGGSVNPLTGEFNFSVQEGYWVKNGKIYVPVRGATLIGRGAEILVKIDRVGKNLWLGQGMCGSRSGSIPTNVGQPRIRVSGITVGGKGGSL